MGFIGRQQAEHEIAVCPAAKRVNGILGCRKSQSRDGSSPTTQHSLDHSCNTMCSFGSPNTEKISTIGSRFSKGHLDAEGPEHLACVEGLRELGLVSPEMGWQAQQNICQPYNGAGVFTRVHSGKMADNWRTLEQEKLSLNIRTNCPHGNRQAVEQVTWQGCAVSLLSWRFSKPE